MTLEEVETFADVNGVPKWRVDPMLKVFHELGVMLHFSQPPALRKVVVLQPQWLWTASV